MNTAQQIAAIGGATMSDIPPLNLEAITRYQVYFCRRWNNSAGEMGNHWDAWTETYDTLEESEKRIATLMHTPPERVQIWEAVTQFRRVK